MNQDNQQANPRLGTTIGTVGDLPIFDGMVQKDAGGEINEATSTPAQYATSYGRALDKEATQALLLVIAKQKGVNIDENTVKQSAGSQFDQQMTFQKEMLGLQNKIPQNATDQQLDAYLKQQGSPSIEQQRQDQIKSYVQAYEDPQNKTLVERGIANDLVMSSIENGINITDDDLKHSNDQYVTKAIYFYTAKHPGTDIQKLAEQVLADLKANKITFDQAMDKYTDQPAAAKKQKHDNTNLVSMGTLKSDPNYQPLLSLKPGQISDVLPYPPQGVAIYELQSVQTQPIPDFDKQKDTLRKNQLEQQAATELQSELKKARQSGIVKWTTPGANVLYNWYETTQADNNFASKPVADQHSVDQSFLDKGIAAGDSYGLLAAAGAMDPLWTAATPAEKKTLAPKYMLLLQNVLQSFGSYPGSIELVQLAADAKDKTLVDQGLSQAAEINDQAMDSQGLENFHDLVADLEKYQSDGMITSDQVAGIRKILDSWRTDKIQYDAGMLKQEQENAVQQAKQEKEKQAAMLKAQQDALKAQQAAAKAAKTAPTAPGAAPKLMTPTGQTQPGLGIPNLAPPGGKPAPPATSPSATPKPPATAPGARGAPPSGAKSPATTGKG